MEETAGVIVVREETVSKEGRSETMPKDSRDYFSWTIRRRRNVEGQIDLKEHV